MSTIVLWSVIGTFLLALTLAIALRPVHGMHERERGNELSWLPATLAPLPAPEAPWRPRPIPDVPQPTQALTEALRAAQHPCYQWAARLAAMSWQSHKTLQRSYDMLAFATVINALERHEVRYA